LFYNEYCLTHRNLSYEKDKNSSCHLVRHMRVRVRDSKYGHYVRKGEGRKGIYGKGYRANTKSDTYAQPNAESDTKPDADTKSYSSITNTSTYPNAAYTSATGFALIC
jgi:hypothetical protein